ncbi:MAG: hypothetical protein K0S76_2534 [Herbinix sp.]|jgi:hypothetical protein|nr:hypothetical protein [Herbinix sp.]
MKKLVSMYKGKAFIANMLILAMVLSMSLAYLPKISVQAATSAYNQIAASSYNSQFGIDTESCSEGGLNVAFIDNNDYIVFNNIDFGGGATSFEARVASAATGGNIEIRLDSLNGTLVGTCSVTNTGNWQNWVTRTCTISGATGTHNVYLKFTGGSGNLFNVNWFKFNAGISAFNQIAASSYNSQFGTDLEGCSEGGQNVAFIDNNDYLVFNNINFGSGASSFEVRVASAATGGNIEVRLDSLTGTRIGICSVTNTGNWQNWVTRTCSISGVTGVHNLYLKFTGGSGNLFNLNWFKFSTSTPTPTPTPGPTGGDVVGKLTVGYQGWFNCSGDNSTIGGWNHWSGSGTPQPGNTNFEIYPDMREYTATYATGYANFGNGQQAKLFSSYDQSTVNKHFEWMQTYNIDGAALQRFGASGPMDGWKQNRDSVAVKVKNAAETYGRKFYVMYDITGMPTNTWHTDIQSDWTNNVINTMHLTDSSAYAHQDGKPVVCIWGIGFTDRPGDLSQCTTIINWFKNQGYYVIGGVPTYWRTGNNDSRSGFESVYRSLDMISPWSVARFGTLNDIDNFIVNQWQPDNNYCQQYGIDYQPVMWPGSAWSNLQKTRGEWAPQNENPRLHGDFMWKQAYKLKSAGISTAYVAMFDEYDEGTAIAKAAENSSMIPTNEYFLTMDADGVACSSDFYLRLTRDINRMFKGQLPVTQNHPTSHQ